LAREPGGDARRHARGRHRPGRLRRRRRRGHHVVCGRGRRRVDEAVVSTEATTAAETTTAAESGTTGEATAGAERDPSADLVIWIDSQRAPALKPAADKFGADNGITVALQEIAFDKMRDQLGVAGPGRQGPDIIVGAHDWLGELTKNGLLAPVDLGGGRASSPRRRSRPSPTTGSSTACPYAVENIGLFRNTELVPEAPKTFEELEKVALALKKSKKVKEGLVLPATPADPYHNYPLFTSHGGYVFGQTDEGYDPTDLGIDSPGGLKAADAFRKYVKEGLINPSVSGDIMQEMFGKGQAAFAITGPWALVQDGKGSTRPASSTRSRRSRRSQAESRRSRSSASRAS
jgi:maltose-binding protein MalE